MKIETILTLGIVGVILFLVYEIIKSFGTPGGAGSNILTSIGNVATNAATGQLSDAQIATAVSSEGYTIQEASGCFQSPPLATCVSAAQADAQAQNDQSATEATSTLSFWDGVKAAFEEVF